MELNETSCCGMNEIEGLSHSRTAKEAMLAFCQYIEDEEGGDYNYDTGDYEPTRTSLRPLAQYVFTGTTDAKYGPQFKAYILENKLGSVVESRAKRNPNSGNMVRAWIWTPSTKSLKAWWAKNKET